jgi:hypothetical protein
LTVRATARDTESVPISPRSRCASAAIAVAVTLFTATLAVADEPGLQVEVDPETGAYSLPAPGRLPDTTPRAAVDDEDVVITPGTSAAGGFKATRRDMLLRETAPPPAGDGTAKPQASE